MAAGLRRGVERDVGVGDVAHQRVRALLDYEAVSRRRVGVFGVAELGMLNGIGDDD